MKIAVVGTGYVGLVTGTCLANVGHDVTCVDIDETKVSRMRAGQIPIYEPGLENLFRKAINEGHLAITNSLADGISGAEVIFLALPTPPSADGSADLSAIMAVSNRLGPLLHQYTIVVDKSTVPVGTGELVYARIAVGTTQEFDVVSNPEFLREGLAVNDFMHPDRIVIGVSSEKAKQVMTKVYKGFTDQLIFMDIRSAEMTKYAANSFLAMKVSFMNEIANLCERLGANVDAVRVGIGPDRRIGNQFLRSGIGYGGSCFPKDVQALQRTAQQVDYDFKILDSIIDVNILQKQILFKKLSDYYKNRIRGKHFAIWGLAFKPDTDDIREAPSLEIIKKLLTVGATITAYDPEAQNNVARHFGECDGLEFSDSAEDALAGADALLLLTEWKEFAKPDFAVIKSLLKAPVIFDGRNMYSLKQMEYEDFYYASIGRPTIGRLKRSTTIQSSEKEEQLI